MNGAAGSAGADAKAAAEASANAAREAEQRARDAEQRANDPRRRRDASKDPHDVPPHLRTPDLLQRPSAQRPFRARPTPDADPALAARLQQQRQHARSDLRHVRLSPEAAALRHRHRTHQDAPAQAQQQAHATAAQGADAAAAAVQAGVAHTRVVLDAAATVGADAIARLVALHAAGGQIGQVRFADEVQGAAWSIASGSAAAARAAAGPVQAQQHEEQPEDPAKAAAAARQRRERAEKLVAAAVQRGNQRVQSLVALGPSIASRVHPGVSAADASVQKAQQAAEGTIRGASASAQGQARAAAGAARSQISGQHAALVAALQALTDAARQKSDTAFAAATAAVKAAESAELARVDAIYTSGEARFRAEGPLVGGAAIAHADARAAEFLSHLDHKSSWLDGPVHDDKLKASADAARKVGESYNKGLIDEANKQAGQVADGKPKDIDNVQQAAQQANDALTKQHTAVSQGLDSAQQQALTSANSLCDSLLAGLQGQLETTLSTLLRQQQAQLALVQRQSAAQRRSIDNHGRAAIQGIQHELAGAAAGLRAMLTTLTAQLSGKQAPPETLLAKQLAQLGTQIDHSAAEVVGSVDAGVATTRQRLSAEGQGAAASLHEIGHGAAASAAATASGFRQAAAQVERSATQGFAGIQGGHQKLTTDIGNQSVESFQQQVKAIADLFDKISKGLQDGLDQNVQSLDQGLRGALDGLDADIDKAAKQAADQVQPRWKSVLKVLLIVAVIVVVMIAMPYAIAGVGLLLGTGAFASTVIAGAIVGAAAGLASQVGNNLIDGKPAFEGWQHAMIQGAIFGAVGGAGGFLGTALSKGGSALAGLAVRVGGNMVGAFAGDVGADYFTNKNHEINWKGAAFDALIAGGFTLGAEGLTAGARAVKARVGGGAPVDAKLPEPTELQDRIDKATGVDKGPKYEEAQAKLRDFYQQMEKEAQNVKTVDHTRIDPMRDPVSGQPELHPDGSPRGWGVKAGFDLQEFSHGLSNLKVKVYLEAQPGVSDADLAAIRGDTIKGVDQYFNVPDNTLPSGNRIHVEVEFVDDPNAAHMKVEVRPGRGDTNQAEWYVEDSNPTTNAHELGHQLGLVDKYASKLSALRPDELSPYVDNDSLMGNFWRVNPKTGAIEINANAHLSADDLAELQAAIDKAYAAKYGPNAPGPDGKPAAGPKGQSGFDYDSLSPKIKEVYNDEAVDKIAAHGRELGMSDAQIKDLLEMGSISKPMKTPPKMPLTPDELIQQMDNWVKIVEARGYPFKFESAEAFEQFKANARGLATKYGLPDGKLVVQGSSLRTPNAKDVDLALFVSDEDFAAYAARCRAGILARASSKAGPNIVRGLDDAIAKGFVPKYYFDRVGDSTFGNEAVSLLVDPFGIGDVDFSVMKRSSSVALYPSMEL